MSISRSKAFNHYRHLLYGVFQLHVSFQRPENALSTIENFIDTEELSYLEKVDLLLQKNIYHQRANDNFLHFNASFNFLIALTARNPVRIKYLEFLLNAPQHGADLKSFLKDARDLINSPLNSFREAIFNNGDAYENVKMRERIYKICETYITLLQKINVPETNLPEYVSFIHPAMLCHLARHGLVANEKTLKSFDKYAIFEYMKALPKELGNVLLHEAADKNSPLGKLIWLKRSLKEPSATNGVRGLVLNELQIRGQDISRYIPNDKKFKFEFSAPSFNLFGKKDKQPTARTEVYSTPLLDEELGTELDEQITLNTRQNLNNSRN